VGDKLPNLLDVPAETRVQRLPSNSKSAYPYNYSNLPIQSCGYLMHKLAFVLIVNHYFHTMGDSKLQQFTRFHGRGTEQSVSGYTGVQALVQFAVTGGVYPLR